MYKKNTLLLFLFSISLKTGWRLSTFEVFLQIFKSVFPVLGLLSFKCAFVTISGQTFCSLATFDTKLMSADHREGFHRTMKVLSFYGTLGKMGMVMVRMIFAIILL